MNRRSLLKTAGIAIAGTALLPLASIAEPGIAEERYHSNLNPPALAGGKRKLGRTLEVSSLGIGVQNMSRTYQTTIPSRSEMHHIIHKAYDQGITLFDAAEAYGPFEVERILGEGVASFRDKIKISTKFGWNIDQQTGRFLPGLNSQPDHIRKVVEGMLKRLQTDRIDLLYQHRVDPKVPIEDVAGVVKDLIKEGKVLHYGLCEPGPQTIRRAHAVHPLSAIQNEYSMLWRGPEELILPLCEELGIGFVCWSPLGVALLTGAIDMNTRFAPGDIRGGESRFAGDNLKNNLALVEILKKWSIKKNTSPAQLSLAWLLMQKPWIVPIPGTTQMAHMLENAGAADLKFSKQEFEEFNSEIYRIKILGERLPAGVLALSGVEAPIKRT